jgi:hypothetical protein
VKTGTSKKTSEKETPFKRYAKTGLASEEAERALQLWH